MELLPTISNGLSQVAFLAHTSYSHSSDTAASYSTSIAGTLIFSKHGKGLHFAESIILPASIGRSHLQRSGQQPCKVVKAFVK